MNVTENMQVTAVRVTLSDDEENKLEEGQAVQVQGALWEYAAREL